MLGDILLITDKHRLAAEEIIKTILAQRKPKMIIAISGESGSGKSELTHVIAKGLRTHGVFAKPMHSDNYYKVLPLERTEWRKTHGIENVVGYDEYDWDTIYRNIEDFKNGEKSMSPCVDLVTEQLDQLLTNYANIDMLIIDGLYAIKTETVDLRVFIELTYHETKKAQLTRGKEPQNEFRMAVLEQEHKMIAALEPLADIIVDKEYQARYRTQKNNK